MGKSKRGRSGSGGEHKRGTSGGIAPNDNIYPTGTCFDDALDLLVAVLKLNPQWEPEIRLVHGICRAPDGHRYAHAWVEDDSDATCAFYGVLQGKRRLFKARRDEYYANA